MTHFFCHSLTSYTWNVSYPSYCMVLFTLDLPHHYLKPRSQSSHTTLVYHHQLFCIRLFFPKNTGAFFVKVLDNSLGNKVFLISFFFCFKHIVLKLHVLKKSLNILHQRIGLSWKIVRSFNFFEFF